MKTPLSALAAVTVTVTVTIAITTGLVAQTATRVVPSGAATTNPDFYDYYAFFGTTSPTPNNEAHTQYLYDSADVGGPAVWKTLSLRRSHYIGSSSNKATTVTGKVILSNSPVSYSAPKTAFAANHGSKASGTPPVTVIDGKINLPASNRGKTWPEPWFPLPSFASPFVHAPVKGGSLVIEFITANNGDRYYYVEGFRVDTGARSSNGQFGGCQWTSEGNGHMNSSVGYRSPVFGGSWYVEHGGMPSNVPSLKLSLNIIGLRGVGGTAYGMKLPIPISTLGFVDICKKRIGKLFNDNVVMLPMTYTASASGPGRGSLRSPTVNIPNDVKLAGASFYQQPFCVDTDPKTGLRNAYMGWPSKWTVGSNKGLPGSMIYRLFDNSGNVGLVRKGYGQTCQLR
ncbi:MAG: hypothetical protein V3U11_03075 [Planctomycetota bacterium]